MGQTYVWLVTGEIGRARNQGTLQRNGTRVTLMGSIMDIRIHMQAASQFIQRGGIDASWQRDIFHRHDGGLSKPAK